MKIGMSVLVAFILTVSLAKLKMKVVGRKRANSSKIQFDIKLTLFLFGFLPMGGFSVKEDGVRFLCFKIPFSFLKMDKNRIKGWKDFPILASLKALNFKLEKFNLDLKIGTEDVLFTTFLVFVISTFLSVFCTKHAKKIDLKKYQYDVEPKYQKNVLEFELLSRFSVKIPNLLRALFFMKRWKKQKNTQHMKLKKVPLKI